MARGEKGPRPKIKNAQPKTHNICLSPNVCVICWSNEETASHLIIHWAIVVPLWFKLLNAANVDWVFLR